MRPLRPAAFAIVVGSLASVGCLNTDQKEPLVLGQDTRSALTAPGGGAATARAAKPSAFDPTATGGSGLSVQNSFNRTTPGAGTGTSTGNFANHLPPPQVGLPPSVSVPALQGASYGEPQTEPGRTSMPRAAAPVPQPLVPAEGSPFGPPKLDLPLNDPPPKPVVMAPAPAPNAALPTPDNSGPIRPVMPDLDRGSLPAPAVSISASATPLPPAAPAAPLPPAPPAAPGVAAHEPLPLAPAGLTYVPSPTEAPIPGVQTPPKLPPAPPIRPQ